MRHRNKKFLQTMVLGIIAIFLAAFHNSVHATNIYKCARADGEVVYQDFACLNSELMQMQHVEINQSADTNISGLREYEKIVLQRIFEKQLLALELQKRS